MSTKPQKLRTGDLVRLVSPASTPSPEDIAYAVATLEGMWLRVQVGHHALDRYGYLAGRDEDRLADINDAIRDPEVRAIIATRGGKGAYRLADGLDFDALRAHPKPIVGFSEATILHLAAHAYAGVPGVHGACWDAGRFGEESADSFYRTLMTDGTTILHTSSDEPTSTLTTTGRARGILLGGNLDMIATAAGWVLPSLRGAILLVEDVDKWLGHVDRHLTRLSKAGCLDGIVGVAVGQFTGFQDSGGWSVIDVLRDHLDRLGVPVLGGLRIGHGPGALAVPVGTMASLDADSGTLSADSAVA